MSTSNDPYAVVEEVNDDGNPIAYGCEYHLGSDLGNLPSFYKVLELEQFYDMVYPCSMQADKQNAANFVSQQLLKNAAQTWNILPDGNGCVEPQSAYSAWIFGVAQEAPSQFISDFGCQALTIDQVGECCQVVRSTWIFVPTGDVRQQDLQDFLRLELQQSDLTATLPIRTAPIDADFFLPGPDEVIIVATTPPANANVPSVQEGKSVEYTPSRRITVPGTLLITGLVLVTIGVVLIMYRRHRLRRSNGQAVKDDGTMEHGPSGDDEPYRVTVLSDDADSYHPNQHHHDIDDDDDDELDDLGGVLASTTPKYAFDLGQSFKNDVMSTYGIGRSPSSQATPGPTTMQVVAPYPILDETSDSEADSWAQTEGTVGSLEENLDEITAEI